MSTDDYGYVGATALRANAAHEIQDGLEMPVLLSSGHTCILWLHGWPTRRRHRRRPGNRRVWGTRAGPSRAGPRRMSSAHRKRAVSVNERDCQGSRGSGCNAVGHDGDALDAPIHGGRINAPTPHPQIPNQHKSDQGPQPKLKTHRHEH